MAKTTIVDLPEITLWYHEDKHIVHHQIHRYPGTAVLERVLDEGFRVLKENRASKWLSDDRGSSALPKAHHEWAANVWGPKVAAAGWKYWALVPPKELVGQMNMARLREVYARLGVTVNVCADPYQALAWLVPL